MSDSSASASWPASASVTPRKSWTALAPKSTPERWAWSRMTSQAASTSSRSASARVSGATGLKRPGSWVSQTRSRPIDSETSSAASAPGPPVTAHM